MVAVRLELVVEYISRSQCRVSLSGGLGGECEVVHIQLYLFGSAVCLDQSSLCAGDQVSRIECVRVMREVEVALSLDLDGDVAGIYNGVVVSRGSLGRGSSLSGLGRSLRALRRSSGLSGLSRSGGLSGLRALSGLSRLCALSGLSGLSGLSRLGGCSRLGGFSRLSGLGSLSGLLLLNLGYIDDSVNVPCALAGLCIAVSLAGHLEDLGAEDLCVCCDLLAFLCKLSLDEVSVDAVIGNLVGQVAPCLAVALEIVELSGNGDVGSILDNAHHVSSSQVDVVGIELCAYLSDNLVEYLCSVDVVLACLNVCNGSGNSASVGMLSSEQCIGICIGALLNVAGSGGSSVSAVFISVVELLECVDHLVDVVICEVLCICQLSSSAVCLVVSERCIRRSLGDLLSSSLELSSELLAGLYIGSAVDVDSSRSGYRLAVELAGVDGDDNRALDDLLAGLDDGDVLALLVLACLHSCNDCISHIVVNVDGDNDLLIAELCSSGACICCNSILEHLYIPCISAEVFNQALCIECYGLTAQVVHSSLCLLIPVRDLCKSVLLLCFRALEGTACICNLDRYIDCNVRVNTDKSVDIQSRCSCCLTLCERSEQHGLGQSYRNSKSCRHDSLQK